MTSLKPSGIVTLLTDFGATEPFAGVVKGVILGLSRRAAVVDLTHEIPPGDVYRASLLLASAYARFPRGTVHVAVVDPGVGGARRALVMQTRDHFFVGPDNGIFSHALAREKKCRVFALTESRAFLKKVSRTFHGRDIFAPAAARLAEGAPPSRLGKAVDDPVRLAVSAPRFAGRRLLGRVEYADRFGNLVTDIARDHLGRLGRRPVAVTAGGRPVGSIRETYSDADRGALTALWNSDDKLEIAVRDGSAVQRLRRGPGLRVEVAPLGELENLA